MIARILFAFLLLCAPLWGDVSARNGISITTASTVNGRTPVAAINGQTVVSGGGGNIAFLTSQATATPRHDFTGELGFRFDVGASPITVVALGRWIISGNSASHALRICDVSGNTIVSATLNASGQTPGAYAWVAASGTLSASTTYFMFSAEVLNGDDWYDEGSVSSTAVGSVTGSGFAIVPGNPMMASAGSLAFVAPNFQYTP